MKTLEEIKNEVAVKHGYEDWNNILHEFRQHNVLKAELNVLVNEAMKLYAEWEIEEERKNQTDWFNTFSDISDFLSYSLGYKIIEIDIDGLNNVQSTIVWIKAYAEQIAIKAREEQREIIRKSILTASGMTQYEKLIIIKKI